MARAKKPIITETLIVNTAEQVSEQILEVQNNIVDITETVNTVRPIEFNNTSQNIVVENTQPVIDQDSINRERLRRRLLGYC